MRRLFSVVAVLAACGSVEGATYYVRKSGSDSNSGLSPGKAWRTIGEAESNATAGDVVYIGAGTYSEYVYFNGNDGTSSQPIRFVGDTDGSRTGDAGSIVIEHDGSRIVRIKSDHVHLESVTIRDEDNSPNEGVYVDGAEGVVLKSCKIRGGDDEHVYLKSGSLRIEGCLIYSSADYGVYCKDGELTIVDTTVEDSDDYLLYGDTGTTILAERCLFKDSDDAGVKTKNGDLVLVSCVFHNLDDDMIRAEGGSSNLTVLGCTLTNGDEDGVRIEGGSAEIRNTIFEDLDDDAIDRDSGSVTHSNNLFWNIDDQDHKGVSSSPSDVFQNPDFTSGSDYALDAGSPAIDAGMALSDVAGVSVDLDYLGAERPAGAGWDIGAHEHGAAAPDGGGGQTPGLLADWLFGISSPGPVESFDFSSPDLTTTETAVWWPKSSSIPFRQEVPKEKFALRLTGEIFLDEPGTWQFRMGSDDGSILWLDGVEVIDHGGLHGFSTRTGTFDTLGGWSAIEVRYFEWGGHQGLTLEWRGPSDGSWSQAPTGSMRTPSSGPYTDITAGSGLTGLTLTTSPDQGSGAHAVDVDSDGDLDLVLGGSLSRVLLNNGLGAFSPSSLGTTSRQIAVLDLDGDLNPDLWSCNREDWLRGDGAGGFTDQGDLGFTWPNNNEGCAAADVDADGRVDVVVFSPNGNRVGRNVDDNDDGTPELSDLGSPGSGVGAGLDSVGDVGNGDFCSTADANGDGHLDFFYHYNGGRLFLSNADGSYASGAALVSGHFSNSDKVGSAWGDYDNDGDMDLFIPDHRGGQRGKLYRNDLPTGFSEVGLSVGLDHSGAQRAAAWGDYDNDGRLDLYITTDAGEADALYQQLPGGGFSLVGDFPMIDGATHDAVFFDMDVDGDLDLVVTSESNDSFLLRNNCDSTDYLRVLFIGAGEGRTNTAGIGVSVTLLSGDGQTVLGRRDLGVARGFGGTEPLWAHFGGVTPSASYTLRFNRTGGREHTVVVTPSVVTADVGGTILPQTYLLDERDLNEGVRVLRWREVSVFDGD